MLRTRIATTATAVVAVGALGLFPAATGASAATTAPVSTTAAAPTGATASSSITQVIAGVGTFVGTFSPTGFTTQNGQLAVTGLVSGTLTTLDGATVPVSQTVTTTVTDAAASGSCKILDLTLGPIHLDLLGLVVDLNQVHLTITAQQGPGNLLGNLLCAVANLLNGSSTSGLAALLNRLLGL